ncbi:MAG: SGNH/GDSL hydrolase family protein [Ktedonobacteraceae bacterium]
MNTWSRTRRWILAALILLAPVLGLIAWRLFRMMASDDPTIWKREIAKFKEQDRHHAPPQGVIVFTGSSSIRFWKTLEQDMALLPGINRGFGGAKIRQVTYYADQIVIPYRPRAVVLFAGTNDLGSFNTRTAREVFEGYVEFVKIVHAALPETPIYYIAITPTLSRWKTWPIAREANQRIKAYTETDSRLHFIDMTNEMLGPDGRPKRDLYIWDRLHPSAKGYALWTSIIKPTLEADLLHRQESMH